MLDYLLEAFVTLFVTVDPLGLAPLFIGLTEGMGAADRRHVALRAVGIATGVLVFFALAGGKLLALLGISLPAFRIAGGLLLFWIAFEMIFERRNERKEKTSEVAITRDHIHNIAVFPLALPLIAGPGAISATILLSGSFPSALERTALIGVLALCIGILFLALVIADRIDRFLGNTGRAILTRLLGVILAALAVQFVADGVKAFAS